MGKKVRGFTLYYEDGSHKNYEEGILLGLEDLGEYTKGISVSSKVDKKHLEQYIIALNKLIEQLEEDQEEYNAKVESKVDIEKKLLQAYLEELLNKVKNS